MQNEPTKYCRVCGLQQPHPQYGNDGKSPTYEICDCCGVEFGYEDLTRKSVMGYRKRWIEEGCKWFDPEAKPSDWNFNDQMRNVPK